MIILFGSYAKGKQVQHRYTGRDGILYEYISDYDFLVVTKKVTEETSDQEWLIEERAEAYEPDVNLEIHEIDFINQGLQEGQYFFVDILKEGVLLYNSGDVKLAEPRLITVAEEKADRTVETFFSPVNYNWIRLWYSYGGMFGWKGRNRN